MSGSGSVRHARNYMIAESQELKKRLLRDPQLRRQGRLANQFLRKTRAPFQQGELMGLARGAAGQAAERAATGISRGLASRGGGAIGAGVGLQSQARAGAATQGVQAGVGMETDLWKNRMERFGMASGLLNQFLSQKYGVLGGILAGQAPVMVGSMQAGAQMSTAPWQAMGSILGGGAQGVGMGLAMCHVAFELFGPDSPDTYAAMAWTSTKPKDHWFAKRYRKHGPKWAKWLRRHRWARGPVRLIWKFIASRGYKELREYQDKIMEAYSG